MTNGPKHASATSHGMADLCLMPFPRGLPRDHDSGDNGADREREPLACVRQVSLGLQLPARATRERSRRPRWSRAAADSRARVRRAHVRRLRPSDMHHDRCRPFGDGILAAESHSGTRQALEAADDSARARVDGDIRQRASVGSERHPAAVHEHELAAPRDAQRREHVVSGSAVVKHVVEQHLRLRYVLPAYLDSPKAPRFVEAVRQRSQRRLDRPPR